MKYIWRFIWDFAEMCGFNFGRFTPWVFGKMIGRKGRRVKLMCPKCGSPEVPYGGPSPRFFCGSISGATFLQSATCVRIAESLALRGVRGKEEGKMNFFDLEKMFHDYDYHNSGRKCDCSTCRMFREVREKNPGILLADDVWRMNQKIYENGVVAGKALAAADLEAARESGAAEMRDACIVVLKSQKGGRMHTLDPADYGGCWYNIHTACSDIKKLGPLSSLESRVRRETVERVREMGKILAGNPAFPKEPGLYVAEAALLAIEEGTE